MGSLHRPRHGSLAFWPRKKAAKALPSVNWKTFSDRKIETKNRLLGFIAYKVGMGSALVKDNTQHSMTKGKSIVIPATLLECPPMKILAVRFYKDGKSAGEVLAADLEKEMKRKLKLPKKTADIDEFKDKLGEFSDIRVLVYSLVKRTGIKKAPDIAEVGLYGTAGEKFEAAKSLLGKEISVETVFGKGTLLDVHCVTKGKGFSGPVKRFGISLRHHKSEKGVRKVGSIGPWHPARTTFKVAFAGQLGFFSRVQYNNKILSLGKSIEEIKGAKEAWPSYGLVKTAFCIAKGSVGGAKKRPVMLTVAARPTKKRAKENFELMEVIR